MIKACKYTCKSKHCCTIHALITQYERERGVKEGNMSMVLYLYTASIYNVLRGYIRYIWSVIVFNAFAKFC